VQVGQSIRWEEGCVRGCLLYVTTLQGGILGWVFVRGACFSSVLGWAEFHCFGPMRPILARKVMVALDFYTVQGYCPFSMHGCKFY